MITAFFLTSAAVAKQWQNALAPLYRVDVRSVLRANALPQLGLRESPWVPVISISFLDNQRLAVTLVAPAEAAPRLATRGEPNANSPFRLRALVIDAQTGRILATPGWPTNSRATGIVAVNDKGFLVLGGRKLTLFSRDLAPIRSVTLPSSTAAGGHADRSAWGPRSSWSGKRLLLVAGPAWANRRWLWVDAENLQILKSWDDAATGPIAVSDDQIVMEPFSQHFGGPPRTLMAEVPGGSWESIPSTLYASAPQFVAPDLLYFGQYSTISHPGGGVFLMRMDSGEISRLQAPHKGWGFGQAAASRDGNRFVFPLLQEKGFHPALDIGGHSVLKGFMVFDPPFRSPSLSLVVKGSEVRNPVAALSPDGRHVAVLGYPQPLLEVFDLPPRK